MKKEDYAILNQVISAILGNRTYIRPGYTEMKSEVYGLFEGEIESLLKWQKFTIDGLINDEEK